MEQALAKVGTLDLVKPTAKEELLNKISEMKQNNLTAEQKAKLAKLNNNFGYAFKVLVENYFGLSKEQVSSLSDQEKEALFFLVTERAKKTYKMFLVPFAICVPIIGWVTLGMSETKRLVRNLKKIEKMLGKNLLPSHLVKQALKSDWSPYGGCGYL